MVCCGFISALCKKTAETFPQFWQKVAELFLQNGSKTIVGKHIIFAKIDL